MQHALEVSQLQSEVREQGFMGNVVIIRARLVVLTQDALSGDMAAYVPLSLYSLVVFSLIQVNYRPKLLVKGAPSPLYSQLADTAEIQFAREMTEMHSEVEKPVCSELKISVTAGEAVIS